jgi:hypothetical protein
MINMNDNGFSDIKLNKNNLLNEWDEPIEFKDNFESFNTS